MSYTHYWRYDPRNSLYVAAEPQLLDDARRIILAAKRRGIYVTSPWRRNGERVSTGGIALNGWPPPYSTEDPDNFWEESFVLGELGYLGAIQEPKESDSDSLKWVKQEYQMMGELFGSCTTAGKPYDLVVATLLLRASELMRGVFLVSSDGCWDDPK